MDYVYNPEVFDKDEDEQFKLLTEQMNNLGFNLEYELGIDKLRSLCNKKLMFSKKIKLDYINIKKNKIV